MSKLTVNDCISHILRLTNQIKSEWDLKPDIDVELHQRLSEILDRKIQDEIAFLKTTTDSATWIQLEIKLLDFFAYGSFRNEQFFNVDPTISQDDNLHDRHIDDYVRENILPICTEAATVFLNRHQNGKEWKDYLKSHPPVDETEYEKYQSENTERSKNNTQTQSSYAFFKVERDGGEMPSPLHHDNPTQNRSNG